jgi:hypothetical protein
MHPEGFTMMRLTGTAFFLATSAIACNRLFEEPEAVTKVTPEQVAAIADANIAANDALFAAAASEPSMSATAGETSDTGETSDIGETTETSETEAAAKAMKSVFAPAGCMDATPGKGHVTIVLEGCTGMRSSVPVNGTIEITMSPLGEGDGSGVKLEAKAHALQVGSQHVDLDRTGYLTKKGRVRILRIVHERSKETGAMGNIHIRETQGELKWNSGASCATFNGLQGLGIGEADGQATYTNVVRCMGKCVTSGFVKIRSTIAPELTLTYDGTATADVSTADGPVTRTAVYCSVR